LIAARRRLRRPSERGPNKNPRPITSPSVLRAGRERSNRLPCPSGRGTNLQRAPPRGWKASTTYGRRAVTRWRAAFSPRSQTHPARPPGHEGGRGTGTAATGCGQQVVSRLPIRRCRPSSKLVVHYGRRSVVAAPGPRGRFCSIAVPGRTPVTGSRRTALQAPARPAQLGVSHPCLKVSGSPPARPAPRPRAPVAGQAPPPAFPEMGGLMRAGYRVDAGGRVYLIGPSGDYGRAPVPSGLVQPPGPRDFPHAALGPWGIPPRAGRAMGTVVDASQTTPRSAGSMTRY